MAIVENLQIYGVLGDHIPYNTLEQMHKALSIPSAKRGILLPDAHYGYSVPIGSVVLTDNTVVPAYIGYDISCMMMLSILCLSIEDFYKYKEEVMNDPLWDSIDVLKPLKNLAYTQLGSSGAGNHFADLVVGNYLIDGYKDKDKQFVALMTHSGSRGVGHKMAGYYMKKADEVVDGQGIQKGYGWLDLDTDLGKEYWAIMTLMGDYAFANHKIIHQTFLRRAFIQTAITHTNKHNFAWKEQDGIIHRKGATPAWKGDYGIIPGSSGTASYLTLGVGNHEALNSSSHGAGRPFSRSEAKSKHDINAYTEHMSDIVTIGVNTDETYQAYKDIDEIINLQTPDIIIPIAKMQPKVVLMGGKGRGQQFE